MPESRYSRIRSKFWTDEKVRQWDDDTRLLALYLLTSPHNNIVGCYVLPRLYACEDLGWELGRLEAAMGRLIQDGFIQYDESTRLLLVVNYLKHNPIENGNQAVAAAKQIAELPKSPILAALKLLLEPFRKLFKELFDELFPEPLTEPLPERYSKPVTVSVTAPVTVPVTETVTGGGQGEPTPPPPAAPAVCISTTPSSGDDGNDAKNHSRKLARKVNTPEYTPDFERFWQTYPQERRVDKFAAFKAWCARLKEGLAPGDLIRAAANYAANCVAEGIEAKYIMRPTTFLGPNRRWETWLTWVPRARDAPAAPRLAPNTKRAFDLVAKYKALEAEEGHQDDAGGNSDALGAYGGSVAEIRTG